MPRAGFESTTPVFERAKTVHALDRAATVNMTLDLRFSRWYQDWGPRYVMLHAYLFICSLFNDSSYLELKRFVVW
jgi:hypothetical protein